MSREHQRTVMLTCLSISAIGIPEVEERGKKHNAELMAEKISDLMKTINPQIKDNQLNKKHEENHTNAHCEHIA